MMATNYVDATDSIYDYFVAGFVVPATELLGYKPELRFRNKEDAKPDPSKFWVRASVFTDFEERTSTALINPEPFLARYTAYGTVMIQLFCPKAVKNSDKIGQQLSNIAKRCYRGKISKCGIVFRNARINELSQEESYYRFNILCDFEYDEIA